MSRKGELSRERMLQATKALVMRKGFAGTSVDDVLREAGVSKGAFLHHFKSKADLAEQLVRWHAGLDMMMFRSFFAEAEAAHDHPMDQLMQFLGDFEAHFCDPENPPRGCLYALHTYEDEHFEGDLKGFVAETLQAWTAIFIRKFQEVIDRYPTVRPVTAKRLAA